jgi:hypothetical protein
MRALFGGNGFIVASSPATTVGSSRTFTTRFTIEADGDITADTNTFVLDATLDRVGVSTSSPGAKFAIAGAGATGEAWGNGSSTAATIQIGDTSGSTGNGGHILFSASQGLFAGIKGTLASGTGPAGNLIFQTRSTTGNLEPRMKIEFGGLVGVSTLASATANDLCYNTTAIAATNVTWNALSTCSSSMKYKEDVLDLVIDPEKVLALRPVEFKWKDRDEWDVGLIAEEVEKIIPELVTYKDGEIEGVKYKQLSVYLLGVLKHMVVRLDAIEAQLAAAGASIQGSIARFAQVITDRLILGSPEEPTGITLFDEVTGEPYCLSVRNGDTVSRSGECGEETNDDPAPAPEPTPEPTPEPPAEEPSTEEPAPEEPSETPPPTEPEPEAPAVEEPPATEESADEPASEEPPAEEPGPEDTAPESVIS